MRILYSGKDNGYAKMVVMEFKVVYKYFRF